MAIEERQHSLFGYPLLSSVNLGCGMPSYTSLGNGQQGQRNGASTGGKVQEEGLARVVTMKGSHTSSEYTENASNLHL